MFQEYFQETNFENYLTSKTYYIHISHCHNYTIYHPKKILAKEMDTGLPVATQ